MKIGTRRVKKDGKDGTKSTSKGKGEEKAKSGVTMPDGEWRWGKREEDL